MSEMKKFIEKNFTENKNKVDKQEILINCTKELIKTIELVRNCEYFKRLRLSNVFNAYFYDNGSFNFSQMNEFLKDFKEKVPISNYDDYIELIDKIYFNGESNILLPGLPTVFAMR
jgi:hypothetical protein